MDGFFKIFPPIGIARVGNSEQFYLAPETPGTGGKGSLPIPVDIECEAVKLPVTEGEAFKETDFRDGSGNMRRQAVRFRIFYYKSEEDEDPQEVKHGQTIETEKQGTKTVDKIVWKVRIANKKASWYEFRTQNGVDGYPPNHPLRNSHVQDDQRKTLIIDPGSKQLDTSLDLGTQADFEVSGLPHLYDGSNDQVHIKSLGTMYLDNEGRLVFVGGYGKSGSKHENPEINSYANNDDWWDDTSDGPVMAQVTLEETRRIDVEPAWVIVAPPAYAPEIPNIVTLYDTMLDVAVRNLKDNENNNLYPDIYQDGFWNPEYKPDWDTQIKPILDRASLTSWVAAMPPKPHTFDYEKLSAIKDGNGDPQYNSLRQYFFSNIRPPEQKNSLKSKTTGYPMMPYIAGDDATDSSQKSSKYLTLTDTQYFFLKQWANGKFIENPQSLTKPEKLTMASLEACVGGAFSPGIEITWICRNPKLYQEPFRIKVKFDFGQINTELSFGTDWEGGFEPGDVTKYMALPWQADFDVCTTQNIDRIVWWWPAQRPLFVYLKYTEPSENSYQDGVPDDTIKHRQVPWVGTSYDQNADDYLILGYLEMVQQWHQLGFIFDISGGTEGVPEDWEGSYFAEVAKFPPREE